MITGNYTIDLRGRPISREDMNVLIKNCNRYIDKFDKNSVLSVKFFGEIAVILTWIGVPEHPGKLQSLLGFLDKRLNKYFLTWKFTINLNILESEK